ncbi:MAG: hypothetical protein Q9165_000333 [Trypethelium subeluteriae]
MARNLLTTADDVISAIEYNLIADGEIIPATALRGKQAISQLARRIDVWSIPHVPPPNLEDDIDIDLQAELDSVDPSIWMDSLDQNPSLTNEVDATLTRKLTETNAEPQIAALHRWLSNAGLPPRRTKEVELMRKVKILYEQEHPLPPPVWKAEPEFFVAIIAELQDDGTPFELQERYFTYDTSWMEFSQMLKSATAIYAPEQQDYTEGYTIKDGPWYYKSFEGGEMQGVSNSGDEGWVKLESCLEYRTMKTMLRQKQDVKNFGVVVRHHQTALRFRILKAKFDEIYTNFNDPAAEWLDENGYPYFDGEPGGLMSKLELYDRNWCRDLRRLRREEGKMLEDDEEAEEEDRKWRKQQRLLRAEKHRKWDEERATRGGKQAAVGAVRAENEEPQKALLDVWREMSLDRVTPADREKDITTEGSERTRG